MIVSGKAEDLCHVYSLRGHSFYVGKARCPLSMKSKVMDYDDR